MGWKCGVKLRDKLSCVELWQQLGKEDIVKVVHQKRLRRYGRLLRKDDDDWVKNCVKFEVEGARQRVRPSKTGKEVVDKLVDDLHINQVLCIVVNGGK